MGFVYRKATVIFLDLLMVFISKGVVSIYGGLDGIKIFDEYIEPDYMIIGGIIGDGTMLCLSKSTGEAYIEDHGEYRCFGIWYSKQK